MKHTIVAALCILWMPVAYASTSLEANKWCRYTSESGKVIFSGQCLVNWGVNGVAPCSGKLQPRSYGERFILTYSPRSTARVELLCKGGALINGIPATVIKSKRLDKPIYRLKTNAGEIYEFELVTE